MHKLVTGRQKGFVELRQAGGLSGYPSREESRHDYVENSHASTILSYAYGMAVARDAGIDPHRHIVAVIGDGSMTGGMAYEALNNLGHSHRRVIIVLNDNGRSYAPTVSQPHAPSPRRTRRRAEVQRVAHVADRRPAVPRADEHPAQPRLRPPPAQARGLPARRCRSSARRPSGRVEAFKAAVREFLQPPSFFESLGVRYVGPVDGHDIAELEQAFRNAIELSAEGPIVVHVLTQKGRGYPPAEDDDEKHLHDAPVFDPVTGPPKAVPTGYTQAFAEAIVKEAEADPRLVAITAAMPGPTGLLPFQARFPDRFFDVGIAEQHAVTGAAGHGDGRAASGRGDLLDVPQPGVGPDRLRRRDAPPARSCSASTEPASPAPTDRVTTACTTWRCWLAVPGMRVLAPSSAQELHQMLHDAMSLADEGPVAIRYPRGQARAGRRARRRRRSPARRVRAAGTARRASCVLAIGKLVAAAEKAADALADGRPSSQRCGTCGAARPSTTTMIADAAPIAPSSPSRTASARAASAWRSPIASVRSRRRCPSRCWVSRPATSLHADRPERSSAALGLDAPGIVEAIRRFD